MLDNREHGRPMSFTYTHKYYVIDIVLWVYVNDIIILGRLR